MLFLFTPRTSMLSAILGLSAASLILSILVLVAGDKPNILKNLAIITFDTSSVSAAIQNFLGSSVSSAIPDWYEPHYLSVCYGLWLNRVTHTKNLAATTCESRGAGYTFSLAGELASKAPSAAQALFTTWPTTYGTLVTGAPLGLLTTAIPLMAIAMVTYLGGLVQMRQNPTYVPVTILRIAFFAGLFATVLLTNGAAQITARAYKAVGSAPAGVPVHLTSFKGYGFFVVIWLSTALAWVSVLISVILSFHLRTAVTQQLWDKSAARSSFAPPKEISAEI